MQASFAFGLSAKDLSVQYWLNMLFDKLQLSVLNYSLYLDRETWSKLDRYRSQGHALLQVFDSLLYYVLSLLRVEL